MKRCSTSLITRDMWMKTSIRYHLTPVRIAIIKKTTKDKKWWEYGGIGVLVHHWWECEMVQPLLKKSMEVPQKVKKRTNIWVRKSTSGCRVKRTEISTFKRYLHSHVYCSIFRVAKIVQFSSALSCVRLFVTPWTTARQASLSITKSQSLPKLMSIESVMPSNHLILCRPLLRLPSIFPSIRVFSHESGLHIRWPKYWSFSFNISPSSEHSGLISFRMDWLDLLAVQ